MENEPSPAARPLTDEELRLVRWMLINGTPNAQDFLPQLELAKASAWKCPCGCASFDFAVDGGGELSGGMNIVADFLFGDEANLSGIFVYVQDGILAGLEVYGLAADAPARLPTPESLRSFPSQSRIQYADL